MSLRRNYPHNPKVAGSNPAPQPTDCTNGLPVGESLTEEAVPFEVSGNLHIDTIPVAARAYECPARYHALATLGDIDVTMHKVV